MTTMAHKHNQDAKVVDEITAKLSTYLADHAVLYMKTLNFHWNMIGPHFFVFHRLLEEQYTELAMALDEIAEHIRSFDRLAPGSMQEFVQLARLKESKNTLSQDEMVHDLIASNEMMTEFCSELIALSDHCKDPATTDLLTQRLKVHEKAAWLLRSHYKK